MSYHDAFKHGIDQSFDEEPSSLAVYWKILGEMNAGVYRRGYVDVVVQRALDQPYDIYDAWVFAQVHCMSKAGDIQILRVELGHEPASDKAIAKNNSALVAMPTPFHGTFDGGPGDFDGEVTWAEPILVGGTRWEPGQVPLEVGTTRCATTWLHLCRYRWLARWPYGSTDIYILQWKHEAWQASRTKVCAKILPAKFQTR
jgi:hypothetical protein